MKKSILNRGIPALALSAALAYAPASSAALATYSQNWEGFGPAGSNTWDSDAAAISGDGWVIGNVNVTTGGAWFAGQAAPNNAADGLNGYSSLVTGQGGPAQGDVQLSIFSDYNSWSPFTTPGTTLQTFVYKDIGTIDVSDVGKTFRFSFDGKLGGVENDPASQAWAYISVLKQSDGTYSTLANPQFDSDAMLTTNWSGGSVEVTIDAGMVGELLQIGFAAEATDWGASGVYYDNLSFSPVPVPAAAWLFGSGVLGMVGVARRKKARA